MDTTPPDFTNPITLTQEAGYLVARWASAAFVDPQDSYDLDMEFTIGQYVFIIMTMVY